jgi:hypothetical protein
MALQSISPPAADDLTASVAFQARDPIKPVATYRDGREACYSWLSKESLLGPSPIPGVAEDQKEPACLAGSHLKHPDDRPFVSAVSI